MPDTCVQITNVNCGDTISSPFSLQIEYTLMTQNGANLVISDALGASIATTPQLAMPSMGGTPSQASATLTYSFPAGTTTLSPESISVALVDSNLNILATDGVGNVTVANAAGAQPVQITPPPLAGLGAGAPVAPGPAGLVSVNSGTPINGVFLGPPGPTYRVFLTVESRAPGKRRRLVTFMDYATTVVPPAAGGNQGTWQYNNVPGGVAGSGIPPTAVLAGTQSYLRVVVTANGSLLGATRAKIS